MIEIYFSDDDLREARSLAMERHDAKDISFRNSHRLGNHGSEYAAHTIGILGELAWAKYSNQEIDKNIYPVRDPGEDFPNVEVKAITYVGKGEPELKIKKTEYEARDPSLYVLVRIDKDQLRLKNTVEILGTISKKSFDQFKIEKQYGEGMPINYIVPLSVMGKPIDDKELFL